MKYIFSVLFLILFTIAANAQDCVHKTNLDRFENLRVLPPSQITMISGTALTYVINDAKEISIGELKMTPSASVPKDVYKIVKGRKWWIMYCIEHSQLYFIQNYAETLK